jgi:hypothetical protein
MYQRAEPLRPHGQAAPGTCFTCWTPRAHIVKDRAYGCYPSKFSCSTYQGNAASDHPGNAMDCFSGKASVCACGMHNGGGDALAAWVRSNEGHLKERSGAARRHAPVCLGMPASSAMHLELCTQDAAFEVNSAWQQQASPIIVAVAHAEGLVHLAVAVHAQRVKCAPPAKCHGLWHIWSVAPASEGWRSQGKSGCTYVHYDHVHVSVL